MKNIERYLNRPKTYSKFLKPQSYKSIFTQNLHIKYTKQSQSCRQISCLNFKCHQKSAQKLNCFASIFNLEGKLCQHNQIFGIKINNARGSSQFYSIKEGDQSQSRSRFLRNCTSTLSLFTHLRLWVRGAVKII